MVNFSFYFTSSTPIDIHSDSMNVSLNKAYAAVHIPTNYISFQHIVFDQHAFSASDSMYHYNCSVFTRINAVDKPKAFSYEAQINSDPDSVARSDFAEHLAQILRIGQSDVFDMSVPIFDIETLEEAESDDDDTANIVVWFIAVIAICAVGALILIICWKTFSGKESEHDRENRNSINLEFLLDPNGSMDAPMHIDEHKLSSSGHDRYQHIDDDEEESEELMEEIKPIKRKKRVRKLSSFGRLSESGSVGRDLNGSGLRDTLMTADGGHIMERGIGVNGLVGNEEEFVEVTDDEELGDQGVNPLMMDDYDPPNMQRL